MLRTIHEFLNSEVKIDILTKININDGTIAAGTVLYSSQYEDPDPIRFIEPFSVEDLIIY